jgi:transcription antitermination protein NusB
MTFVRGDGVDLAARSRARRRALQAVYAWPLSGRDIGQIRADFANEQDMQAADIDYFDSLTLGVAANLRQLDEGLSAFLDRTIDEVDPIERAVLRLAAFELKHRLDVPYRVVLNEAVEVAKRFGSEFGHTYVNGVLDKLAGQWRTVEYRR